MPRRTPRLVAWGSVGVLCVVASVAAITSGINTPTARRQSTTSSLGTQPPRSFPASPGAVIRGGGTDDLFGLERDGRIAEITPNDGLAKIVATGAAPNGGIAEAPNRRAIFFTTGIDQAYCPAIELKSLVRSSVAIPVVRDAELPSVSPDGSFLAFATTNDSCVQDGVGIVRIDATGEPAGEDYGFLASQAPLPLPITGVTVSRGGREIAFAGGLVDSYLGPHDPTVFVLDSSRGESFDSAQHLADGNLGLPLPFASVPTSHLAFDAPAFTPGGTLLVADSSRVAASFSEPTGLSVETVRSGELSVDCVAFGPGADVALVNSAGALLVADQPGWFSASPLARPSTVPSMRAVGKGYAAVAWSAGGGARTSATGEAVSTGPSFRTV